MSKRNFILAILLASFLGGLLAIAGYSIFHEKEPPYNSFEERQKVKFSNLNVDPNIDIPEGPNFVYAAKLVTPGVVHIKTTMEHPPSQGYNPFEEFFGMPRSTPREEQATGSGVLISDDGYIATNNHMVDGGKDIEVTLYDNRKFKAKVVGTDPTTDLALLKINAKDLPFIKYGNSDDLQVGEWVLAVGNPFELTSTVTAGIVSAKARNINILHGQNVGNLGIESFIQTDAAINPGNSGGALVNLKGELVGINTAIATNTGSYAGYGFAVPVALVKKVMDDLLKYGVVQRALLGISIRDLNADLAKDLGIKETSGVYVAGVNKGSAAEEAGLKEKDVIIGIGDNPVKNVSELQEHVARHRPGDKVTITLIRNGKEMEVTAKLKNIMGEEKMYARNSAVEYQGATMTEITDDLKDKLDIDGGVQLNDIESGIWAKAGIKDGFIITKIGKKQIKTVNDVITALSNEEDGVFIGGIYPDGEQAGYGIIQ